MIAGMVLLGAVCVALGVFPGFASSRSSTRRSCGSSAALSPSALLTVRGPLVLASGAAERGLGGRLSIPVARPRPSSGLALLAGSSSLWPRAAARRLAPTWTCGMTPESRFDYTATAFAKPLRFIFAALYRPRREVERETGPTPYFVRRTALGGRRRRRRPDQSLPTGSSSG